MGREPQGDPEHEPVDPATIDADRDHDLRRAMLGLPADQRAAISLFYQEGFSIAEIAEALCTPAGTVKTRLFHARCALRRYFNEGDDE
jgi:RNA polymerase sigma-70 factor (ECF subfamily)